MCVQYWRPLPLRPGLGTAPLTHKAERLADRQRFTKLSLFSVLPPREPIIARKSVNSHFLQDWGKSCPYDFLGAFKLQYDMSWTPVEKLHEKDQDLDLINRIILGSQDKNQDPFAFRITDVTHDEPN